MTNFPDFALLKHPGFVGTVPPTVPAHPGYLASGLEWDRMERAIDQLASAWTPEACWEAERAVLQAFGVVHRVAAVGDGRVRLGRAARRAVLERDHFSCVRCRKKYYDEYSGATVDHLFPVRLGGCNAVWNLTTLCPGCNTAKGRALVPWALILMVRQAGGEQP